MCSKFESNLFTCFFITELIMFIHAKTLLINGCGFHIYLYM